MDRTYCKLLGFGVQAISYSFSPALSKQISFLNRFNGKRFRSVQPPVQTMEDINRTLTKLMDAPIGWVDKPRDRADLLQYLPKSQEELPPRTMNDSYSEAIIPLSKDLSLQNRYVTAIGKLRMGRVLEDMDLFSAYTAFKYLKNPLQKEGVASPYCVVTIGVDDIQYTLEKPDVTNDVKLSGKVVLVGQSSLDVHVELFHKAANDWNKMTIAHFKMAARNSTLTGPAYVNKLMPKDEGEQQEMQAALARKLKKSEDDKISLLKTPPNDEEQALIHQNFLSSVDLSDPTINRRILPAGFVWMEDTKMNSNVFPHPENRNHHNTVFGGYLMRIALELAWMTAYTFSSQRPSLRYVSNISFRRPVLITSLLKLMSQVIYTERQYMQIAVYIDLYDVKTRKVESSNSFHFTYEVSKHVPPVMPRTYHESILWLEGRRQLKKYVH